MSRVSYLAVMVALGALVIAIAVLILSPL